MTETTQTTQTSIDDVTKVEVFYIVNPSGIIHEIGTEEEASRWLGKVGYRQPTAAEVKAYEALEAKNQSSKNPIAKAHSTQPKKAAKTVKPKSRTK